MGRRSAPPAPRGARALLLLALAGAVAACAAPAGPGPAAAIDPSFEPAFEALRGALEDQDDALAERILARILARNPDAPTRAHAEVFGRILRGRQLGRALDLQLQAEPADDGATMVLFLQASHSLPEALELRGGAGTLRQLLTGLDAAGTEQRVSRSVAVEAVERVRMAPGETTRLRLGRFETPAGGALAVQADWDLRLPAGSIRWGGEDYPLSTLDAGGCSTLTVAPWLPQERVDPGELARYVASGGRSMPALVERAVRVDPARRGEALDALVPVALELPRMDLMVLVPVLRWLSDERALGADVDAWASWLAERTGHPAERSDEPALDLPGPEGTTQTASGSGANVPSAGGGGR